MVKNSQAARSGVSQKLTIEGYARPVSVLDWTFNDVVCVGCGCCKMIENIGGPKDSWVCHDCGIIFSVGSVLNG